MILIRSSECVECNGTNGGYVVLFLLLSFGFVLVTHKLAQQASGTPKIFAFFIVSVHPSGWFHLLN